MIPRRNRGKKRRTLTDKERSALLNDLAKGKLLQFELARKYDISQSQVSMVKKHGAKDKAR